MAVLACAVIRPFGLPEATVAVPAAGLVIGDRRDSLDHARAEAELLGPVVGFLAAVLVLAKLCDDEGLFRTAARGWPVRRRGVRNGCWPPTSFSPRSSRPS